MPVQELSLTQFQAGYLNSYASQLAAAGIVPNLNKGSIARAFGWASSNQCTILQLFGLAIVNYARSSTASGSDLDSFYAQFAFPRQPAKTAFGTVTFSTPTANTQDAYIPVGVLVQNLGGSIQYQVIADPTQTSYNSSLQAYVLPAGQLTVNATVQALASGATYNVQPGVLIQIVASLYGIYNVTNPGEIINGANPQTDPEYRTAFIEYINNLSKGTVESIEESVQALGVNYKIALVENVIAVGNPPTSISGPNAQTYGNILMLVDDGTGVPTMALLAAATAAVDATRAAGIRRQVFGPAIIAPAINVNIRIDPLAPSDAGVELAVKNAILAYVNSLPIGGLIIGNNQGAIYYGQIYKVAMAVPYCDTVEPASVTIGGVQDDYLMQPYQEAILTAGNVNVGSY